MDYLAEFNRIVALDENNTHRANVLSRPLFVLLVGLSDEDREAIRNEFIQRWSSPEPYIILCDVRFDVRRAQLIPEDHGCIRQFTCQVRSDVSEINQKVALSQMLLSIVQHERRCIGGAGMISNICVICDAKQTESSTWAARLCLILRHCLGDAGAQIGMTQLYCLLTAQRLMYRSAQKRMYDAIHQWRTNLKEVLGEELFPSFDENGRPAYPLVPCSGTYGQGDTSVFDSYVFIDETNSSGIPCTREWRIRILAMLLDNAVCLQAAGRGYAWPGVRGDCYSAWLYPVRARNLFLELATAWQVLHERFKSNVIDDTRVTTEIGNAHGQVLKALVEGRQSTINRLQKGYILYNTTMWGNLQGQRFGDLAGREKQVFADALQNKFDYLWRRQEMLLSGEIVPQWRKAIEGIFGGIQTVVAMEGLKSQLINDEYFANAQGATVPDATINRDTTIDDLRNRIVNTLYPAKFNKRASETIMALNRDYLKLVERRIGQQQIVMERAETLEELYQNAQISAMEEIGRYAPDIRNIRDETSARCRASMEALLAGPNAAPLHAEYNRALNTSNLVFDKAVVGMLEKLYGFLQANNVRPTELPLPAAGDCLCCQTILTTPVGPDTISSYEDIESGRDSGMRYFLATVDMDNLMAFSGMKGEDVD